MSTEPRVRNAVVLLEDGSIARAHGNGEWTVYPTIPQPPINGAIDPGYITGWSVLDGIGIVDLILPVTSEEARHD